MLGGNWDHDRDVRRQAADRRDRRQVRQGPAGLHPPLRRAHGAGEHGGAANSPASPRTRRTRAGGVIYRLADGKTPIGHPQRQRDGTRRPAHPRTGRRGDRGGGPGRDAGMCRATASPACRTWTAAPARRGASSSASFSDWPAMGKMTVRLDLRWPIALRQEVDRRRGRSELRQRLRPHRRREGLHGRLARLAAPRRCSSRTRATRRTPASS